MLGWGKKIIYTCKRIGHILEVGLRLPLMETRVVVLQ